MACNSACLKWLLPERSFSDRWSKGTKLWEQDCEHTENTCTGGIGVRAFSDFGRGGGGEGGDLLARKIYAFPECVIVEIGIQTHSN